jgi:hypothetical protein
MAIPDRFQQNNERMLLWSATATLRHGATVYDSHTIVNPLLLARDSELTAKQTPRDHNKRQIPYALGFVRVQICTRLLRLQVPYCRHEGSAYQKRNGTLGDHLSRVSLLIITLTRRRKEHPANQ